MSGYFLASLTGIEAVGGLSILSKVEKSCLLETTG